MKSSIVALTLVTALGAQAAPSNGTIWNNASVNATNTSFVNASLSYNFYNASLVNEIATNLTFLYDNFTDVQYVNKTNKFYNSSIAAEVAKNFSLLYGNDSYSSGGVSYSNGTITEKLILELFAIDQSTALDDCERCVTRLELGKSMAYTRPELIAPAWTQWCIESEFDTEIDCLINYGRNTVKNSTSGANFVNMLTLMDPAGYDGQLYCYYQESVCEKPQTPKVDISYMWPAKKDQYKVAPTPGNETFNVLHLSDVQMELNYQIGAELNCTDSVCCTPNSVNELTRPAGFNFTDNLSDYEVDGMSFFNSSYVNGTTFVNGDYIDVFTNESVWWPANTFGNYQCDAPEILLNSSLNSIVNFQAQNDMSFDFAIFTGDLVDHDPAQFQSFEKVIMEEELAFRDMKYKLQDLPVFPVLGNHDTFPYAQLAQRSSGYENLFDWNAELMADLWEDYEWLEQSNASYAAAHYAGFSVTTKRGLKIISLNANAWYNENLYNYWNASNPDSFGQFKFVVDELVASEAADQRVWIIAHVPFNEEALPVPALAFAQIVERFSPYTIAGIFFGHTHLDQFNVLYAGNNLNSTSNSTKTPENAINNAWISQAITPWVENNPSWRYYSVDTKTFSIMNSYNYYTKLNETFSNGGEEPIWEFEYSAREAYNIAGWAPTSPLNATFWHYVAQQIKDVNEVNQKYTNFESRLSPYTTDCESSGLCRGNWCYVTSFTVDEFDACKQLSNITAIYEDLD